MATEKLIPGIILIIIGILFFFNNKNMGKGASKFYKFFYSKRNLTIIFRIIGIILIIGGILLLVLN